jgi:hypothetical protein
MSESNRARVGSQMMGDKAITKMIVDSRVDYLWTYVKCQGSEKTSKKLKKAVIEKPGKDSVKRVSNKPERRAAIYCAVLIELVMRCSVLTRLRKAFQIIEESSK